MSVLNSRAPKKVGSKPKRGERVYKRTAKAQRDLFRRRRCSGMSAPVTLQKSRRKRYAACGDVAGLDDMDTLFRAIKKFTNRQSSLRTWVRTPSAGWA